MATIERLDTSIFNENTVLHLHRYALACEFVSGKIVLDIASGEGYGSNLLSKSASFVYGVDIDENAVNMATEKYKNDKLEFILGSTSKIPLAESSIDVLVSFETLEHHDEHEQMFQEIKRVLKPEGIVIISTPDKHYYSDVNKYRNEFHVKELYKSQFISLIKNYFNECQFFIQSNFGCTSIIFDETDRNNLKFYNGNYINIKTQYSSPDFLIAIISNSSFKRQSNSIFDGTEILQRNRISKHLKIVYNSNSYKIGHLILLPIKLIKRGLKNFW